MVDKVVFVLDDEVQVGDELEVSVPASRVIL